MSSGVAVQLTSTQEPVIKTGIELSLLKLQTIAQTIIGGTIVTSVVVAVVVGVSVFATTVGYDYPVTLPDAATTYKVTPTRIYVLLNDKDPRGANLTIVKVTDPTYGKVKIVDGSYLLYTPQKFFAGVDTFNYTAQNDKLQSSAQVVVTVLNRPPEVIPQTYNINKNSKSNKAQVFLYKNEAGLKVSDIDGDKLVVSGVTAPASGTTTFDDENVYYTPNLNFNGVDTCNYTVSDGNDTATHVLTFITSNNAPVAKPDYVTIPKNTWWAVPVLDNDFDINNDPLTVSWCGNAGRGSCIVAADGKTAEYTPEWSPTSTTDSFEYTISDGSLTASSFALLTIVNNPPKAQDKDIPIGKNSGFTEIDISSLYSDSDEAEYVSVKILEDAKFGQTQFRPVQESDSGASFAKGIKYVAFPDKVAKSYYLAYKPNAGFQSIDTLKYEVTDSGKLKATGTIRLIVGNLPPVAPAQSGTVPRRGSTTVNVMTGVTDPNGDEVNLDSVVAIPGVTKGTVSKASATHASYTAPNDASVTSDTFQYIVKDVQAVASEALSATGTVTISIFNQAPVPADDTVTVPKGLTTNINVLVNDADPNQDPILVNSVTAPTKGGSANIINGGALVAFTAVNSIMTDTFTYDIKDNVADSLTSVTKATVTVNVVNTAPVAANDAYNVFWNSAANSFNVLANDDDINPNDKSILAIDAIGTPSQVGSVSVVNNIILYTPRAGFVGTETFTYTCKDETLSSNTATVTVTVINNAPVAAADSYTKHHATQNVLFDVLSNDSDPQNDPIVIVSTNNNRAQIVTSSGKQQIQYSSVAGFVGTDTFTYTISDNEKTATATVTVTVTDTAPVTANDAVSVHWSNSAPQTISVLDNDSDNEKDTLTLQSITTPQGFRGSASVSGNNVVFAGPGSGFKGVQNIPYTVSDGALTSTGTLVATVTNNDVPVAPAKSVTTHWRTQAVGTTLTLTTATDADGDTNTLTFTQPQGQTGIVTASGATAVLYRRPNWKGTDAFSYTISDGLDSANNQVTITVTNAVPTVPSFTEFLPGNKLATGVDIDALSKCSDADGADATSLTITSATGTVNATVSIVNGKIKYIPTTGYVTAGGGTDTIQYTVSDGLDSASGTISVVVPTVSGSDVVRSFDLLWRTQSTGSSLDLASDTLVQQTPSPAPINAQSYSIDTVANRFVYRQNNNYLGQDYAEVFSNNGQTIYRIKVFLNIYNTLPTCNSLSVNTHWRLLLSGVNYDVMASAADADGDTPTLASVGVATRGTTSINAGQARYVASAPFLGPTTDTFNFQVSDGIQTITRSVTITPTNANKPTAPARTATAHWRTGTVTIPVLSGPTDADGDTLTLTAVSPAGATVTVSGNNLIYSRANFVGQDSFTYTISDGIESASGTVTVTFTNTAPVANPDTYTVHWRQASATDYTPLSNDVDANSDPITITGATITSGSGTITGFTGTTVSFRPAGNTLTSTVITYTISDTRATAQSTMTISMTNAAPVASQVTASTKRTSSVNLQAACTDANSDPLTYGPTSLSPTKGTATWGANGAVTYTPGNAVLTCSNGVCSTTDTFSYTCSDGVSSGSNNFVVTITNNVPVARDDSYTIVRNRANNPTITLNVVANDTDADGDSLTISAFSANNGAVVVRSADQKTLSYTPNVAFAGVDTVPYTVTDGSATATATARITLVNNAPACNAISQTTLKGQSVKIYPLVAGACSDANNDPMTFTIGGTPAKGTTATGSDINGNFVTYTPAATRSGTDSFTYTVSDGFTTVTRTITITITNRAPNTPADKTFTFSSFVSSRTYTLTPLTGTSDPDGDSLSVISITDSQNCLNNPAVAGTLSLSNNVVTYVSKASWSGTCEFTYVIRDNDADNQLTATGKFIVTGVNSDPIAIADYYTANQNTVFTVSTSSLLANDYDINNDTISFDILMCGQTGYTCQKTPTISGSTISIAADTACGQLQFYYRIKTQDGRTGVGSFFVKYINCRCSNPADVIFLQDGSGSISDTNWGVSKDFVNQIVDKLDVGTNKVWVGFVQFSDSASYSGSYGFNFIKSDAATVKSTVNSRAHYKSWTGTIRGLDRAVQLAQSSTRTTVAKTIIIITDGAPNRPCDCNACASYYGNQAACTRAAWPGMTCSNCVWDTSNWCMPCADPRDRAREINAFTNPKYKIVSVAIGGDLSPFGEAIVKDMAFDPSAYFRVGWDSADTVVSKIIDETCY